MVVESRQIVLANDNILFPLFQGGLGGRNDELVGRFC